MKNISTISLAVIAMAIAVTGTVIAQEQDGSDSGAKRERGAGMRGAQARDPEKMIRGITRRLELDEIQVQQVRNIIDATKPEFEAMREQGRENHVARRDLDESDADYAAKRDQVASTKKDLEALSKELRGRMRTEINAVLTPEQQAKFSEAENHGSRDGRRSRPRDRGDAEIG
jgi:Spy/CpxP family protein refolding chaperone